MMICLKMVDPSVSIILTNFWNASGKSELLNAEPIRRLPTFLNSAGVAGIFKRNISAENKIKDKLIEDHGLSKDDALWVLTKIGFKKVDAQLLEEEILKQLQFMSLQWLLRNWPGLF